MEEGIHSAILKFSGRTIGAEFTRCNSAPEGGLIQHQEGWEETWLVQRGLGMNKKKSNENVRYVPCEHLGVRAQGKEPKCLVHAWGPASQHGGEMRSCHGFRKQAGQVTGRHSLAQLRLQKALSGSSAVPCSPFNSFQLPLTSKSSSFPAFRVLLA